MALIVNRSQQVTATGMAPKAAYSRNVVLQMRVQQAGVVNDFAWTPVIGNRFWLLGIKIWFMPETVGGLIKTTFGLTTGTGIPSVFRIVRDDWEPILGEARKVAQYMQYWGEAGNLDFPMMRYYTGGNRRLGCVMQFVAISVDFWAIVSFEISEG